MPDGRGDGFGAEVVAAGAADIVVGVLAAQGELAHFAQVVTGDGRLSGGVDVVLALEAGLAVYVAVRRIEGNGIV